MNIKINFYIMCFFSFILFKCIIVGQFCFPQEPHVPLNKTTTDFRQLSNQEILEYGTEKQLFLIEYQMGYDSILQHHCPEVANDFPERLIPEQNICGNFDMTFLQQLGWYVETNKSSYQLKEEIEIHLSLKNISDKDVSIATYPLPIGNTILSIELKKNIAGEMQRINLTKQGVLQGRSPQDPRDFPLYLRGRLPKIHYYTLKPGEKGLLDQQMKNLNRFYDLSASGEYELMFYTRYFIGINQVAAYPKPCTIHFKIEDTENEQKETTTQE